MRNSSTIFSDDLANAYASMGETIGKAEAAEQVVKWRDALAHTKDGVDCAALSAPPVAHDDFVESLVDDLTAADIPLALAYRVAELAEKRAEERAFIVTISELRRVYLSLGKMAAAECLRVAMLGDLEESIREMAKRLKRSHTTILKTVKKIRQRVGGVPVFPIGRD